MRVFTQLLITITVVASLSACAHHSHASKSQSTHLGTKARVLEMAQAQLQLSSSKDDFLKASEAMHLGFFSKQPGFLGRQVWLQSEGKMGSILQWKDLTSAQTALGIALQNKSVQQFV